MLKYFIITVDTEGDNLWDYKKGDVIQTLNSYQIPRFQELCDKFCYKPVYLTNYEMASDKYFVTCASLWQKEARCEIGVHLHAWNNPPQFELSGEFDYNPYLIEYPENIMRGKFAEIFNLITDQFGQKPVSHRAGRWAMNPTYFNILHDFGIITDCSFTPGIDWSKNVGITQGGSNYLHEPIVPRLINDVLEVPMTIRTIRSAQNGNIIHRIKTLLRGNKIWLRPSTQTTEQMKKLITVVEKENKVDYLELMIHSSELLINGSPFSRTQCDVERIYKSMVEIFNFVKAKSLKGITLREYHDIYQKSSIHN